MTRTHKLLLIGTLANVLLTALASCAEVCRSTKYPNLVLDVNVVRNAEAFMDEVLGKYQVSVNNSFRSFEEQEKLYRQWIARGGKGNPVAKPGFSRHEAGFAFDLNKLQELTFIQWDRVLNIGERYGFEYLLGDFPGEGTQKFDWPHFQASPIDYGLTLNEALARNHVKREAIQECVWKPDVPKEWRDYLNQIVVTHAHFSTAVQHGQELTYLDAMVTNDGNQSIRILELRAELYDSVGGILQVRLLHLGGRPIKARETRAVHLLFGRVYDSWREGAVGVRPTYVE